MDTWSRDEATGDALVDCEDATGEIVRLRVPWEHRHTSIGWGRRKRVAFNHHARGPMHAVVLSEGKAGVMARDEEGTTHLLPVGSFEPIEWPAGDGTRPMAKAEHPAPPPGSRWITVHPHGPGSKGQAILVMPAGDGTHRVIGGAGGSMNHLRLRGVDSVDESRAKAKARRKEAARAERDRRKALTPEERAAEDREEEAKQKRQRDAERKVVETVREKWGGIDEDLDEDATAGLSDAAAERLHAQHHRKQFAQAQKARKDIAQTLARDRIEHIEDEAAVDATISEDPDLWTTAHEMGQRELAQIEAEEDARRQARTPIAHRAAPDDRAAAANQAVARSLENTNRAEVEKDLEARGGREGSAGETASAESRRRAAEAMHNALILHEAAKGTPDDADPVRVSIGFGVIAQALKDAGVDQKDPELVRQALENEARIQVQQAQLHKVKAEKFEAMERSGKAEQAVKALAKTDLMRGLTREVRDATRRLGLREDAKTPLKQAEIAEMMEVLGSFEALRDANKALDAVVKVAEPEKFDRSRRGFTLAMSEPEDHVLESVEELVTRQLAQRIVGMADEKSSDHVKAVTDGHYAKFADISMSVDNQNHLDRSTVDALGLKNASVLLRHALEGEGHKADDLHNALVGHHVREQKRLTAEALRLADAYVPNLEAKVAEVGDMEHALKSLDAHEGDIAAAQRAIGSALGQMEATATLAQTMRGKQPEHLTIDLKNRGASAIAPHLTWLASVGLGPEHYEIDPEAKEIRIPKEHWGKLIRTEDKATVDQRQLAHAIKRGEHDEEGWMPKGMVSRSSTSFTDPPKDAPRYHTGLDLGADDIHTALGDHIGSRLADGERPHDIATDLLSPQVAGKAADPEAFTDLVREFFPTQTPEDKAQIAENSRISGEREQLGEQYRAATDAGDTDRAAALAQQIAALPKEKEVQPKRDIHFADHYNELAAQYLRRKHPDASPIHGRSLYDGADEGQVREAVFRALASNPEHVAAFTPIGELKPDHRRALQDYFYKRAGISETRDWSKEFNEELSEGYEDKSDPANPRFVEPLTKRAAASSTDQSRAVAAQGGGGLFGGGAPAAKPTPTTAENFGERYPKEAKELAQRYPREGRALFRQAMGPRPAEPTEPSKLAPHVTAAIDKIRETRPALPAHELAREVSEHLGRERAAAELKIDPKVLDERGPDGRLTDRAKLAQKKLESRGKDLAERGVDPREIHRVYGAQMHDAELEQFEDHARRHSTPWASFVDLHGGQASAYQALQEEMRGEFSKNLAEHYGKVTGQSLQTAIGEVPNSEIHAAAISSPRQRRELAEARRAEIQANRGRGAAGARDESGKALGGKFTAGSATERYKQAQDAKRSIEQRQGGLFGTAPKTPGKLVGVAPNAKRPPKAGERISLGTRAENEVTSLVSGALGQNMSIDSKVKVFPGATMDGRRIHQQRVIKMLRQNGGRLGAWLGTGSGKTPTSIGAFTDLHASGDASHGLFLVPTAVQNQFGEEMLSFTEPGKYRFETGAGKGHADRAALLRDKNVHMRVMTHQSATRTVLRMAADHHGIAPEAMLERLRGMPDGERAKTIREALDAHGVPRHFTYVDEAHGLTTRQGEQESDTSIVIGALTHPTNSTHALLGTATPHKNDTSEIYAMGRLLDPERYSDAYRFTQNYGVGSVAAPDAVRRELDHRTYTAAIPPDGVQRIDTPNPTVGPDGKKQAGGPIALHPKHEAEVKAVSDAYESAIAAARRGQVDVDATRKLSPGRFEGVPEGKHEAIARELAPSLGIVKETAVRKALQLAPVEHNNKLRQMTDTIDRDVRAGKPSIVFTDSLEEAQHVHQTLAARGLAAGVYHGGLSGDERDDFRRQFADGRIKVGVMTSAGEAGINMQSGKVIHHYDVPKTQKSWAQRVGRAYRQGQKDDVDVHDWTFDHEFDAGAQRRLQDKAQLGDVFSTPLGPLDEHGFARDYHATLNAKHAGIS